MSDTPRTDRNYIGMQIVPAVFAQKLERELNAANAIIRQQQLLDEENLSLRQRIKRLEEAGDNMAEWLEDMRNLGADATLSHAWREAKEAKP